MRSNILEGVSNLPLVLKNSSHYYPSNTALDSVDGTSYSYKELDVAARYIATMLQSFGMGKGDRIAILSENNPHWGIAYFGIITAGAITVPILPDFQGSEVISILEHAEAKSIIISGKLISRLDAGLPDSVELVINLDNFQVLDVEAGKITQPTGTPGQLHKLEVNPEMLTDQDSLYKAEPDELASIIYTSGTTGRSKGVMLTHNNILSNAKDVRTIHQVVQEDRFLSILPLAHTYEFTIGFVVPLLNGATIHYIDRAPTASYLGPVLQKLAPTTMLTVPLIIEKIYRAKIKPALSKSPLIRFLMKIGITRRLLSKAATRKLLKFFGGNLRFFGVGGAPLAPDVERFLLDGGFPYAIGYGLTETSPMLAGFGPSHAVYRSVGTLMKGVTLKIHNPDPSTKEGEIVVKAPYVMKGYYKDEEKTKEVFTKDGFFRTGDLGYISKKGILYIRGRSKNMILGPNGENIYPEEIEALINSEEIVSESLVMQYKGKLIARVHLADFQQQLQTKADEVLDELLIRINQHVALNSRLQKMIQQIQPFEKTPTQKIKRFLYN